jgi:uncharacterized protein (DUF433 family)
MIALPVVLVPHPHVRVDANVLGGSPYIAETRVPVRRVWAFYRDGTGVDKILKRFPQIPPAKIFDALAFALDNAEVMEADVAHEREMLKRTGQRLPTRSASPEQIELPFAGQAPGSAPRSPATRSRRR